MTVRYRANYQGTGELMNGPEMQAMLRQVAEKGKAYAESISPVGQAPYDKHPGEYKESFEVTAQAHGGFHGDRAEAQIVNTSNHAAAVEWGNSAYPPWAHGYHVLARTASALRTL
jgi:hypothetical protein